MIAAEQFASRIRAAVDSRINGEFVIIAGTDSRISGGVGEAIRRLNLYVENGADMGMVGDFNSYEDYVRIVREVKAPMVVCASAPAHFALQPDITLDQWKKAGVKMVLYLVPAAFCSHESSSTGRKSPKGYGFGRGSGLGPVDLWRVRGSCGNGEVVESERNLRSRGWEATVDSV
ncbi:MAG: isocitrate lyase/phosphoenolpyruvate mutase family protein [Syntrophobacteraceae bacterium]